MLSSAQQGIQLGGVLAECRRKYRLKSLESIHGIFQIEHTVIEGRVLVVLNAVVLNAVGCYFCM